MTQRHARLALVFAALCVAVSAPVAQQTPAPAERYAVRDVMIPTRDGTKLFTRIYAPKDQNGPLPIIMHRTPYGNDGAIGRLNVYMRALADDGYIFVFQDIRGKFRSEGTFVMQRPARAPGDDEGDRRGHRHLRHHRLAAQERAAEQRPRRHARRSPTTAGPPIMGALEPHPALKAISPQASPADMWLGDDFHHNGAFRLSYGFEYAAMMESGQGRAAVRLRPLRHLRLVSGARAAVQRQRKVPQGRIPTWNDYVAHPDYDEFWKRQTMIPSIRSAKVPTLNVAGWWDQEDFYGPVADLRRAGEVRHAKHQLSGGRPWNHGGWARGTGERSATIPFGSATVQVFPRADPGAVVRVLAEGQGHARFAGGADVRSRLQPVAAWDSWPPKSSRPTKPLYFGTAARSRSTRPVEAGAATRSTATFGSGASGAVPPAADPGDVLRRRARVVHVAASRTSASSTIAPTCCRWETPLLEADVTIAGDVVAQLFASTTGSDADWIVKLIDVYPEQYPDELADWPGTS